MATRRIALLADWLVSSDLDTGRLLPVLEEFDAPPAPVCAVTAPGRFQSTTIRSLIDHLAAALPSRKKKASKRPS